MKRLAMIAVLGLTALAVRRYRDARDALAAVAPDLRSPLLPFISETRHAWLLPLFRLNARIPTRSGPGVIVTERHVGQPAVRVMITTPAGGQAPRPGVLWIHGGGYVVGSPQLEAFATAHLARDLNVVTVSPDYRLAPVHPFPAALDDCMAVLRWMRSNAEELGIDPTRVAVMGASAGGGLSAAVAQRSHDEGIPLRAQVLAYPMLDDRTVLRLDHEGRGRFMWTPASNRLGWSSYLGREPRMSDAPQYAAPARRTDLTGLAPAWVGVGELDLFYDEDVAYAQALKDSGVDTTLVIVAGMYHGADAIRRKSLSMKDFRASMHNHLRTYLAQ
ncbi:alpha/beta hydrolase [Mycobacterium asiaticum]|uniref:Alpha/beta hydrolase n=1 Tax=Mycobacterium asiaticum TaxID=1790 RepID=A0A1A3P8I1_MYCAS|nr:alpha/beta hydrolase [Mycobacterium asiaticum]OBK29980.1 alpha/beta hydrolase [Mycobacterium asiaticum]